MATQEEILEKYKEDRLDKILRLQRILSSRIAQDAKSKASKVNDVSVISTTLTIDDIFSTEELKKILSRDVTTVDDLKSQIKPVRQEIIDRVSEKLGSPDSTVIFLIITCEIINTSVDSEKEKISCTLRVRDELYVKEPNKSSENLISSGTDSGTSAVEWVDASSFEEISKKLSIVSYPTVNLQKSNKFLSWLTDLQSFYKRYEELPPFESIPILVHSELSLRDFNLIFPKPEGLTNVQTPDTTPPTPPGIGESGATGTSGIGGATGTSGIGGATGTSGIGGATGTSGIGGATGTGETNGGETGTTTSVGTSGTSGNSKYLSIEAIKDDDPVITADSDGSAKITVISTSALEDTDQYWIGSETAIIRSENAEKRKEENPLSNPSGTNNSEVPKKEKEEIVNKTEAQQKAEESDALVKEAIKEKSTGSASGANPGIPEGVTAKKDEEKPPKEPEYVPPSGRPGKPALPFLVWMSSEGKDDNGIIYRNPNEFVVGPPNTPENVPMSQTNIEFRYKSVLNYGNKNNLFKGISIESPLDVGLAMNGIQIGLFNPNVPYMFGEGSEIHLVMVKSSATRLSEGGVGKAGKGRPGEGKFDANWGETPFWCGIFTNFCLYANEKYESDDSPKNISGTSDVNKYYVDSPFNISKDYFVKAASIIESEINGKNGIKDNIRNLEKSKIGKEKEYKEAEKNLNNYIQNTDTTEIKESKKKKLQANYNGKKSEFENVNNKLTNKKTELANKESELSKVKSNQTTWKKEPEYNKDNIVALFEKGIHINEKNELTREGLALWNQIKLWPGAYAVRNGHVEVLLHWAPNNGKFYTLGGNTGISENVDKNLVKASKPQSDKPDSNGYQYGFKVTSTAGLWASYGAGGDLWIVKRGTKNPYTNGIGVSIKKTKSWDLYSKRVSDKKDVIISPAAFNLINGLIV